MQVSTTKLDDFWTAQGLAKRVPRFIKIDVEGYEYHAFQGAIEILKRCPLVMSEYSPCAMRNAGVEPTQMIDLMLGIGFNAYTLSDGTLQQIQRSALIARTGTSEIFWRRV